MFFCIFDKTTKLFAGASRGSSITYDNVTQVLIELPDLPDERLTRLNATNDGVTAATQAQLDEFDRPGKIREVKAEAHAKVLNLVADWSESNHTTKQLNQIMLAVSECYNALVAIQNADTAARDTAISNMLPMKTLADSIKAIRDASDLIEADISTAIDVANYDVVNSAMWP